MRLRTPDPERLAAEARGRSVKPQFGFCELRPCGVGRWFWRWFWTCSFGPSGRDCGHAPRPIAFVSGRHHADHGGAGGGAARSPGGLLQRALAGVHTRDGGSGQFSAFHHATDRPRDRDPGADCQGLWCVTVRAKLSRSDDARALVRQVFESTVDLLPNLADKTLTVRLHPLATAAHDQVLEHLCSELRATQTVYPGTELTLIVEPVGASEIPRDQES
jgi:hypothetical protein